MLYKKTRCKAIPVLCFYLFTCLFSRAQEGIVEFGQVTNEDLNLKECSFDKNADAVILLDKAVANFNDEYNLITERRIRLKILKEKGIERANIRIPYYSANDFEMIRDINAVVITPDEKEGFKTSELERKNIFDRKVNSFYSIISFALPNVKVGSVIDYTYRSIMKNYGGLRRWEFQTDIPVITSYYDLAPLPNSEFAWSVYKSAELPIKITPDKANGRCLFMMNNIPGLRDEVYSASTRNFLQRVNFQFASYTNYMGKKTYTSTWEELAKELQEERSFGSQANKDLSGTIFIKSLSTLLQPAEKLKAIHDFVRTNITWNDINSKYCEDGVKNILDKKKGNSGDINLLLVSLLKSAGLEAYPLLVSERDNGLVDTAYSFLEQFNKVVAYVNINGTAYVVDGTDLSTPSFMIPSDLLNTIGFLVDKKKRRFVYFNNLPHRQREYIGINASVGQDGTLSGSAIVRTAEYAKLAKERRYKTDLVGYKNALLKPYPFVKVDSFSLEGLHNDSVALTHMVNFHFNLKKAGGYYLLTANLFTGMNENPFMTQHRFTDIDFGTKYNCVVVGSFSLPPSLATEALPANKKLVSPDRTMAVSRFLEEKENQVNLRFEFEITREKFAADEYEMVKAFFKEAVDLMNEPVVLKDR